MPTEAQRAAFRRVLQQARSDCGLSQRDLAARVGVSPSAVSQWEMGQTAPRPQMAESLEHLLQLADGALSRLLGYLPTTVEDQAAVSVIDAAEADPRLGDRDRQLLAAMYRELVRQRGTNAGDG